MRYLRGFYRFWYDFIIGDDWKIAAAVATVLAIGAVAVLAGAGGAAILAPLLALGLAVAFAVALLIDTRI
ncbi:MAG TPA: hypothetical protein VJT31_10190 [Rugosimonospora sp.]|nr:hypothetical protein [Rugosimonospora sp.]